MNGFLARAWRKSKTEGFTLVELLIVLVIVGILAGALLLVASAGTDKAQAARVVSDLRNLKAAAVEFNASTSNWPASVTDLSAYLDGPLECVGPVCYEVASNEAGAFVGFRADLARTGAGVKDRLKGMAGTVSLYSDTTLAKAYGGEPLAVYPVGYAGNGAMSAAGEKDLFRGNLANLDQFLRLYGSQWKIVDGRLVSISDGGERRLAFGDSSWTDYTLSLTGHFLDGYVKGNSGYGVYYRADQKTGLKNPGISGYSFQIDAGANGFKLYKVTNGVESSIKYVSFPSGFDYTAPHAISISVTGDHHVISVDGSVVMDLHDSTYLSGSAGLRAWYKSSAEFSDIVVNP